MRRYSGWIWFCLGSTAVLGCGARADESGTTNDTGSQSFALGARHEGHPRSHAFRFVEHSDLLPVVPDSEGTSTTDVDLVDVDADGDLDLFATNGTAGPAGRPNALYINDGSGRFTDETSSRLAGVDNTRNSTKTAWGDVDGDGDIDAFIANLGQEQLLLNDGHGFFTEAPAGHIPAIAGNPATGDFDVTLDASLADVNGDGALDVLVSNENPFASGPTAGAQNRLYLNDGAGVFRVAPLPPAVDQTATQLAGDIDGDGDVDIVVLNRGQDRVLIGDGTGRFVEETSARIPLVDQTQPNVSSARGGGLADLDGDGDLDLIVGNSRGEPVEYYKNNGAGVFAPAAFPYVPGANDTVTGLVLVDLDGDGDLDVYLPDAGKFDAAPGGHGFFGGPDHYFENDGRGRFKDRTSLHFAPPSDPTTSAAFGDIDDDGDLDLIVGNTDDNVPGDTGGERLFVQERCGRD